MSVQAHLAPAEVKAPGTQALCGYVLTGIDCDHDDVCPRCTQLRDHPAEGAMLAILEDHTHEWSSAGASISPGGWSPTYRCVSCEQVVVDIGTLRHVSPQASPAPIPQASPRDA